MKLFIPDLNPSEADLAGMATIATAAIPSGSPPDEATWLGAVRQVQRKRDWQRHPAVLAAYDAWRNEAWRLWLLNQTNVTAGLWDHARYRDLARYSYAIYEQNLLAAALEKDREAGHITVFEVFEHPPLCLQALAYVRTDDSGSQACLVFRGTIYNNKTNWFRVNFDLLPKEHIHRGFRKAWLCFEPRIRQWLEALPARPASLRLAGHSLGGAIAVVAASRLADSYPISAVVTFGSPGLARPAFAAAYERKKLAAVTRRYIHKTDIVPRSVPDWMYAHLGSQFFVSDDGVITQTVPRSSFELLMEELVESTPYKTGRKLLGHLGEGLAPLVESSPPAPASLSGPKETFQELVRAFRPLVYGGIQYLLAPAAMLLALVVGVFLLIRGVCRALSIDRDITSHAVRSYEAAFDGAFEKWSASTLLGSVRALRKMMAQTGHQFGSRETPS